MKTFWLSWYGNGWPFTLDTPWWISGYRFFADENAKDDEFQQPTICAAVRAESKEAAKEIILAAHDARPSNLEWRFVDERPADWSPFTDRFPRADWMQWA